MLPFMLIWTAGAAVRDWRPGEAAGRAAGLRRWVSVSLVSIWKHDLAGDDRGTVKSAGALWSELLHYGGRWPRFWRIGAGLFVGLVLWEAYFASVRPQQPLPHAGADARRVEAAARRTGSGNGAAGAALALHHS